VNFYICRFNHVIMPSNLYLERNTWYGEQNINIELRKVQHPAQQCLVGMSETIFTANQLTGVWWKHENNAVELKPQYNILIYRWHTGHCMSGWVGSTLGTKMTISYTETTVHIYRSVNCYSTTCKDLETQIRGLLRTNPVFKYFQGLEFREKKFQDFQGHVELETLSLILISQSVNALFLAICSHLEFHPSLC